MRFVTAYLDSVFESSSKFGQLVDRISDKMITLQAEVPFQAIAFRGASGAALAYPLSAQLNIPLIYVRKLREQSHGFDIEGTNRDIRKYVIVDDFTETGRTIKQIIKAIDKTRDRYCELQCPIKCVGIVLYAEQDPDCEFHKEFTKHGGEKIPIYYWGVKSR